MTGFKNFEEWAKYQHDIECNQKYDKRHPYSFHLDLVFAQALKFSKIIWKESDGQYAQLMYKKIHPAIYGHDILEDARVTYNDIKERVGVEVAEIIYLCTENKGRNRADRKNEEFYKELKTNELAVFVKLCDIIANSLYSNLTNSSMFKKYKQEYQNKVREVLYLEKYKPMFDYLDKIYEL